MLRDYVWVIYEQQESILKELYPGASSGVLASAVLGLDPGWSHGGT